MSSLTVRQLETGFFYPLAEMRNLTTSHFHALVSIQVDAIGKIPTMLRQCRLYVLVENLNMGKAKQVKKKKKQK
jgi:hypothetical protein